MIIAIPNNILEIGASFFSNLVVLYKKHESSVCHADFRDILDCQDFLPKKIKISSQEFKKHKVRRRNSVITSMHSLFRKTFAVKISIKHIFEKLAVKPNLPNLRAGNLKEKKIPRLSRKHIFRMFNEQFIFHVHSTFMYIIRKYAKYCSKLIQTSTEPLRKEQSFN